MLLDSPLIETIPSPDEVHGRLRDALRELRLLRRMLRLAELAQDFRDCDRHARKNRKPRKADSRANE
jgi:hypothetical protein